MRGIELLTLDFSFANDGQLMWWALPGSPFQLPPVHYRLRKRVQRIKILGKEREDCISRSCDSLAPSQRVAFLCEGVAKDRYSMWSVRYIR